ncbi:choline-binding protein [Clostridiales bacterium TF09-2AC]|nr:choline-binding protein [Clostridiales bacterium TF09-2AC]
MTGKKLKSLVLAAFLSLTAAITTIAETPSTTMESSGAYLFEWRPVDFGDGQSFAILVGGNMLSESNVILNRGYDYGYTFNPSLYSRPWGQVPDLVNIDGIWGIPENWSILPEGSQPTTCITLLTNNKNLSTNERHVHVVHLPGNVKAADLPPEVRKYLINVDGSDAGAYDGTTTSGWVKEDNQWKYRKHDGTFVAGGWLRVDEKSYYMNSDGIMLSDTLTPDGVYVNAKGEKTNYIPGWVQDEKGWRYIQKNGYYAGATWIQGADGNWYYINIGTYMETNDTTPDGYYVDASGVWDGQPSIISSNVNLGPGMKSSAGWEAVDNGWKYMQEDGAYVTNGWKQDNEKWYYFDENSLMVTSQETPDGYYVNSEGVWEQ